MKKLKLFCMASFAALMLGACSDDKFVDGPEAPATPGADEEGVYFTVNIAMPNGIGGRSVTTEPGEDGSTSNSGVEIGKDYENTISEAIVVLAQSTPGKSVTNNGFIAAAPITSGDLVVATADKTNYTAKSKFTKTALKAFYDENASTSGPISANIFLFCNPTKQLRDALLTTPPTVGDTDWLNEVGNVDESSPIWTPNYFLMSNALIATRQIPGTLDVWNNYTKEDKPFHLSQANPEAVIDNKQNGGAIKVERTAARFDFRDGSPLAATQPFTYHVVLDGANDATVEKKPLIDVTLQKMALVNVDKSFYFLPHMISANEQGVMNPVDAASLLAGVCQPEQPWYSDEFGKPVTGEAFRGNYVLSPDYEWKKTVNNSTTSGFAANLLYPFFNENGVIDNNSISNDRWATSLCKDVVGANADNDDSWNPNGTSAPQYYIWRYATENTIPSIEGQVNGVTTGVVFKGKMVATAEALENKDEDIKLMAQTINNVDGKLNNSYTDPILYLFDGNLYMTWENVQKAAIAAANPTFKFVPDEDFNTTNKGTWKIETINRTNSLYVAVFGTGGCGKLTFKYKDDKDVEQTETIDDSLAPDPNSANAAWTAWATATPAKPESGALTDAFKAAVTGADFTIYQSSYDLNSGWGYYCYYYYWNHHNDNGNNGVMGPMELAVVRNNVYKLAVTKIKQLGHPRISANDPNRPTPGTPDESEDVYLDVQAEVLPWVVRVNNIEF